MIKHDYDEKHDILYIRFNDDAYKISREIDGGQVVLDYNDKGEVIGVQIFDAKKFIEGKKE